MQKYFSKNLRQWSKLKQKLIFLLGKQLIFMVVSFKMIYIIFDQKYNLHYFFKNNI